MSVPIRYTRNFFLRAICVVYMFAFISFYIQIPGLYGNNGILPAKSLLENSKHKTLSAKVHYQPTLLWLAPYLGLDTQYALDFLSLLGSFLAFTGFVSQKFCTVPLFAGLWSLYFSLYQVGQSFVASQWDNLLLEAGFLCLLVAPLLPGRRKGSRVSPKDAITFWLVKWLLFRYLISAGLAKFVSGCPKWWDLSALTYHFQSMVLPTPLSWYAHQIPASYLRLTAVFINVAEIILPLLYFVPVRSIRITGFVIQIFLQIFIVLTGNFNFANLLAVTLLVSLLDDYFFFGSASSKSSEGNGMFKYIISLVCNLAVYGAVILLVSYLYSFRFDSQLGVIVNIAFTKEQFNSVLKVMMMPVIYVALVSLALISLRSLLSIVRHNDQTSGISKLLSLVITVLYTCIGLVIFAATTVPLQSMNKATNMTVHPQLRTAFKRLEKMHVANNYGELFTKMTGVNGRMEIILEGTNNLEGPWEEYNFMYKPGNVNHSLPFVAPYSPRLDWQMWWAAQSTYDKQPWFMSLVHRLLIGEPSVLALLDRTHGASKIGVPKFVRAQLYRYVYTSWKEHKTTIWWRRERLSEYLPPLSRDSPALVDYLRARNLLPVRADSGHVSDHQQTALHPVWKSVLDPIRAGTSYLEATLLLWSVFTAGCAIITTTSSASSHSATSKRIKKQN